MGGQHIVAACFEEDAAGKKAPDVKEAKPGVS